MEQGLAVCLFFFFPLRSTCPASPSIAKSALDDGDAAVDAIDYLIREYPGAYGEPTLDMGIWSGYGTRLHNAARPVFLLLHRICSLSHTPKVVPEKNC